MAPFYGWGSTASGLVHFEEAVYFLPLSSQIFLVLILSTSEGQKAESALEPPSGFEHGTPGLEIQHLNHQTIRVGLVWAISASFIYTGRLIRAFSHLQTLNLTYCSKSSLLLAFCFWFNCMTNLTQICMTPEAVLMADG